MSKADRLWFAAGMAGCLVSSCAVGVFWRYSEPLTLVYVVLMVAAEIYLLEVRDSTKMRDISYVLAMTPLWPVALTAHFIARWLRRRDLQRDRIPRARAVGR